MTNTLFDGESDFEQLRQSFARDPQIGQELEWLLRVAVENFNPSSRANRFIVGALVEWGVALAAYAGGILTLPQGHNADGDDVAGLRDIAQYRWSVKSSFSVQRSYRFIIQNVRGLRPEGVTPVAQMERTLFLHPLLPGIVHVDPEVHPWIREHLVFGGDAWLLPLSAILIHAADAPDQVIPLTMPANPGARQTDPALDIVRAYVLQPHFQRLGRLFREQAARSKADVVDRLKELRDMESAGELSPAQTKAAIDALLGL